jgi:hypothetical protein
VGWDGGAHKVADAMFAENFPAGKYGSEVVSHGVV